MKTMKTKMMDIIFIIGQLAVIYLIFQIGEWLGEWLNLPVPGSVVGMGLLWGLLMTGVMKIDWISRGASLLLRYMPLFFLPIMAGVMQYTDLFTGSGLWLIMIVILSTWLVLMVSALVSQKLVKTKERSSS